MSTAPPIPVFVDPYASGPSGITTYGAHLAATLPELRRINLHAPPGRPRLRPHDVDVPPWRSHDAHHIADLLVRSLAAVPDRRVAWLPNIGDVPWAGAWHALTHLSRRDRDRVRLFGIVHGDQDTQFDTIARYAPAIAGCAGVSARCVDRLTARLSNAALSVHALHYPVDVPEARSDHLPARPLRLLYAGRFEELQKRVSRLPALFQALAAAGVPFTASLAGDGPARASLERALAALPRDAAACVRVLGPVPRDRMTAVLCEHDILLLVSAFEGTPLVLLEGMAAGVCPVLMELAGGLPELIEPDANACVVPQGSIADLAAAIGALHRDRDRLARLKTSARATLRTRANPVLHADWLLARLDDLWTRPAPDPSRVSDPDPLGRRVDRVVSSAVSAQPARVAVWGAGVVGRRTVDGLLTAGVRPVMIVDADVAHHGDYRGIPVGRPGALDDCGPDVVCVGSIAFADEIACALQRRVTPPLVFVP